MSRALLRQLVVALAAAAMIAMNVLANALPLNGQATGEISDRFAVLFVPAGYVFSIWGLIYLGIIVYAVYQVLPRQRDNPRLQRIGYLFALSCAANVAWLWLWHYEQFTLTLVAMFSLLGLLIAIYTRLWSTRRQAPPRERWLVDLLFSVYLGWISVAAISNAAVVLDFYQWNQGGLSDVVWTVVMLGVGVGLSLAMTRARRDAAYTLVLVWAYVGIALKQPAIAAVTQAAWAAATLLAAIALVTLLASVLPDSTLARH